MVFSVWPLATLATFRLTELLGLSINNSLSLAPLGLCMFNTLRNRAFYSQLLRKFPVIFQCTNKIPSSLKGLVQLQLSLPQDTLSLFSSVFHGHLGIYIFNRISSPSYVTTDPFPSPTQVYKFSCLDYKCLSFIPDI